MDQTDKHIAKEDTRAKRTEPFVSVLTPVYNGADFLRECIESVLSQDYENWEYVLVNNQSTDDTLKIIKEYDAKDHRIRVHNNTAFLPQMVNLNHAFRQISPNSKYCKVVHADDMLLKDCLTEMVALAETHPSVGVVSAYRLDGYEGRTTVELDGLPYLSNLNSGKEICRKYLMNGTSYFGSPSSLLIRSDLIKKREKVYDESYLAADSGACLELLKESEFGFVHQVLTFTRHHEQSVTNTRDKQFFVFIKGQLKIQLEFGPYYLTKEEFDKRILNRINLYYILLARNICQKRSVKQFKHQLKILDDLGLKFKTVAFIKNLIREIILSAFSLTGMELNKSSKTSKKPLAAESQAT